ncbi:MAG: S8/S53 family peptidase [Bacteroidia bacterium]
MLRNPLIFIVLFFLLSSFYGEETSNPSNQFRIPENVTKEDYAQDIVIIKVKPEYRNFCSLEEISIPALQALFSQISPSSLKKKFPTHLPPVLDKTPYGEKLVDLSLIYEIQFATDVDVIKIINGLISSGVLEYAEPKYRPRIFAYTPNDPSIGQQYFLNNIKAYQAWDISKGDTNVVIGIVDTGTDWDHPDLVNSIKYNYNDPINGIDDDNDGYTDNYRGWDLGQNDNNPMVTGSGSAAHGSHVSGCAAATTDNGIGVASPGFNSKFLPVKISNASGSLVAAYEGIVYAADQGCDIINCSWGGPGGGLFGQDIINYAVINKDKTVIAAAGNDGNETVFFPASYQNVLNVASTNQSDTKSSFSNYGITVDVCAPGSNIYSTWYDNNYSNQGGTSMASPIAAGGAALIKAHNPGFNGLQVAEQLRITADNIYGISGNNAFANKLGRGRINLFRALTESSPSVRMKNLNFTDNNDDSFVVNDTIRFTGDIINYLAPTTNLNITISTTSSFVTILDGTTTVGTLGTLQFVSNAADPFTFKINASAPQNARIIFKITFTDGAYVDEQYFDIVVNVDYINVTINDIQTTITSKGLIGYNQPNQVEGLGFRYKGSASLLYEASLMIGANSNQVSDFVRGAAGGTDNDFVSVQNVQRIDPTVKSEFDLEGRFNDAGAGATQLSVLTTHKTYVWSSPGHTQYIIVEYIIRNNSSTTYNSLFAGIFADWDIADYSKNKASEDAFHKMGFVWNTEAGGFYAGIKLLSPVPFVHYAIDNVSGGAGGINMFDGYSTPEKYQSLSTNRSSAGGTGVGNDVIDVVSGGPFSLSPGDSVKIAFALLAADSLPDLLSSAQNAQFNYDNIITALPQWSQQESIAVIGFPNPANNQYFMNIYSPVLEKTMITLYNELGQLSKRTNAVLQPGYNQINLDISELNQGIYFYSIISGEQTIRGKIMIIR